jgi:hypothetical protein
MPTECNPVLFDFGSVEGRQVAAAFDGGRVTSDAGALLLGAIKRSASSSGLLPVFAMNAAPTWLNTRYRL